MRGAERTMVDQMLVRHILVRPNEILDDAVFIEGNLPTGHRVTIRTGLPPVYWRSLNQGVPRSKSMTAQVDETIGMLEAYSAQAWQPVPNGCHRVGIGYG